MVYSDREGYLQGLYLEIEQNKKEGKGGVYRINANITDEVGQYIKAHFIDNPHYIVETKKCMSCKQSWDIMILFVG